MINRFDIHPIILCSPHLRTIETCIALLNRYPREKKADFVIRLEPYLKECFCGADTTPLPLEDLKYHIERLSKEQHDIKIEFGSELLKKDTWVLDILENPEYSDRLRKAY